MTERSTQPVVLGTAQWGLDYGVTNAAGRLVDHTVEELLEASVELGIHLLDTAPAYGDAEARIGARAADVLAADMAVQTKASWRAGLGESLRESTRRLHRAPRRLLVHDWSDLGTEEQKAAARELETLRDEQLVEQVGVSGYSAADLARALEAFRRLDVAQMPVSVIDQRLNGAPEVAALRSGGGILQARSVYLQGLALSGPGRVPLADHPHLARFRAACAQAGTTADAGCRAFVRSLEWVDEIVVGATSAAELQAWGAGDAGISLPWPDLASDDPLLVDPRRWDSERSRE